MCEKMLFRRRPVIATKAAEAAGATTKAAKAVEVATKAAEASCVMGAGYGDR